MEGKGKNHRSYKYSTEEEESLLLERLIALRSKFINRFLNVFINQQSIVLTFMPYKQYLCSK